MVRNTHHTPKEPRKAALEALAACFLVVRQIIEDHLGERPELLLKKGDCWEVMLKEAETFKVIEKQCRESIDTLTNVPEGALKAIAMVQCPSCSSALIQAKPATYLDAECRCRTCGEDFQLVDVMADAAALAYPRRYEKKIGYVDATTRCPSCGEWGFVIEADLCLVCTEGRPHENCAQCGEPLSVDESNEAFCSYCNRGTVDHDD